MPDIGSDQGPRQPMLQAYRCASTIRPKLLDKNTESENRDCASYCW